MKLEAKIEGGKLSFDVWELLAMATGDERFTLIDTLACHDEIISEVANQLIDGRTSEGSHASIGGANVECYGAIESAWRRIAKASGDIAKREIERLEEALRSEKELSRKGWEEYHKTFDRRFP